MIFKKKEAAGSRAATFLFADIGFNVFINIIQQNIVMIFFYCINNLTPMTHLTMTAFFIIIYIYINFVNGNVGS